MFFAVLVAAVVVTIALWDIRDQLARIARALEKERKP